MLGSVTTRCNTNAGPGARCARAWRAGGLLLGLLGLLPALAWAQIPIAGVIEARGAGAPAAASFRNGYRMAIDEINAGSGVLGQRLVLDQHDIDTTPEAAVAAMREALRRKPFAILGPQFSGITAAAMPLSAVGAVPHFTGGEAASLTRRFHPSLLRTSLSQQGSAPRMAALVAYGLAARSVGVLWIDNEFGRDGRRLLAESFRRRNVKLAFDLPIKPGQQDFAATLAAIAASPADALVLYATELESIAALKALHKAGYGGPIVADGLVASAKVIDEAEVASEGVLVHMNNFVDAPNVALQAFVKRYEQRYRSRPDLNSIKGYFAVQMLKAGLEVAGAVDPQRFMDALRNTRFDAARFPELMGSVSYDHFGDLNRASYFAVIRRSRPQLLATVRLTEGGMVELPDGRLIALDSSEFRRELGQGMAADRGAGPAGAARGAR
jgi:branched-chain amino acid transport system substrate-binding protein